MDHDLFGVGDDEPLVMRLGQAIAWCRPRVDPTNPSAQWLGGYWSWANRSARRGVSGRIVSG